MNDAISIELQFFLISILCGAILLVVYDILRIIRRLIVHNSIFVALEDLIFWVAASIFLFAVMFKENNGIIRGFSIMGMTIGMILYHFILSEFIVSNVTLLLKTLIRPIAFLLNIVKGFLVVVWKKAKEILKFIIRRLKKRTKSVRIALSKKKQAMSAKHQKHRNERDLKKQKEQERKLATKQASKRKKKEADLQSKRGQGNTILTKKPIDSTLGERSSKRQEATLIRVGSGTAHRVTDVRKEKL